MIFAKTSPAGNENYPRTPLSQFSNSHNSPDDADSGQESTLKPTTDPETEPVEIL